MPAAAEALAFTFFPASAGPRVAPCQRRGWECAVSNSTSTSTESVPYPSPPRPHAACCYCRLGAGVSKQLPASSLLLVLSLMVPRAIVATVQCARRVERGTRKQWRCHPRQAPAAVALRTRDIHSAPGGAHCVRWAAAAPERCRCS